MTIVNKVDIIYDHVFEPSTKRHRINGLQSVLHCHHYTALYTQLAVDANETELLAECARETYSMMLANYFANHKELDTLAAKVDIACQYYSLVGMGKMVVNFLGEDSGEVELLSSHTDVGWIKKWGTYDRPVNYITVGFIEALFEVVQGLAPRSFKAVEKQSIVMGAETSVFNVFRR
jgi:hypothetical protein